MTNGHSRPQDLLEDLTLSQQDAVTHTEGPLLVLAGAGSGKTRVITRRVAYLLQQGVRPSNILAITFTNKAAGEMRQRINALVPGTSLWICTFHALGARLLRQYGERLGLDRNFTIYDQTDRNRLVKMAMEDVGLDNGRYTPETIQSGISKAKNKLLSPERFASRAHDFFSQVVAQVYPGYEKRLRDSNALDFDDLLYWPALAMKNDPELRAELDEKFQYVLIDEYQDTNQAQYAIARGLSVNYPNICAVGDPDQCLVPGTAVETPAGKKPIEALQEGELVISGSGWGRTLPMPIEKVMKTPYHGPITCAQLEDGQEIRATPNHKIFAKLQPVPDIHLTYLMWKRGVGYRIGTTRGVRTSKDRALVSGLQVRTNQEVADATWILRTAHTLAEALYYEHLYSVRYGIPTMVFFVRGRRMEITQDLVDQLDREIDSERNAKRLLEDLCMDLCFPHHRPGAVTRDGWARRHILFTMFGSSKRPVGTWSEHRIQLVTTDSELREKARQTLPVREGARGTWRIETSRKDYDRGAELAAQIQALDPDMEIIPRARLTPEKAFLCMPISHLHPGMLVPVYSEGKVVEKRVTKVTQGSYNGPVYDLSIPGSRNYIANDLVVHNSIYAWRGSDIQNILNFEKDFPNASTLTLSTNYRSTKAILHAASVLISHNVDRKEKDLITDNPQGAPVKVLTFETGVDEANGIGKRIKEAVEKKERHYRDFAIFVRVNALTRGLEQAFLRQQIPFQIVRGLAFFDRKENRDVLAYLRLLVNPRDDISFLRVINEPTRGIGKVTLTRLQGYAQPREMSLLAAAHHFEEIPEIKGKAARGLKQFVQMMKELEQIKDGQPHAVINEVLDKSGYRSMLKDSRDEEDEVRLANIEELVTAAKQFAEEDQTGTIGEFLERVTLSSDVDGWDEDQDCVSIMTFHAAKGLEFPVVYTIAMELGILPHQRSMDPEKKEQLEEERRLTFVGMTRAKEELYLTRCRMREYRGQTLYVIPSLFLDELPPEVEQEDLSQSGQQRQSILEAWRSGGTAAEEGWKEAGVITAEDLRASLAEESKKPSDPFQPGALVRHERYGLGRVLEVGGQGALRKAKILFAKSGERTMILKNTDLEVIEDTSSQD